MLADFSRLKVDMSAKNSSLSAAVATMFYRGAIMVLIATVTYGALANATATEMTEQDERLASANDKFAVDVYKQQASATDDNIFASPISISVALAMTYLGARGQTKAQMKDVLHFADVDEDQLHKSFSDIQSALNKPENNVYVANSLFADNSYKFLKEFSIDGLKYYGAKFKPVDFRGNSNGAVADINKWVALTTKNKVPKIVPPDAVDANTRLIIVDAIYFKGNWLKQFDAARTAIEDFHVSPKESVKVGMMFMPQREFFYGVNSQLHCQAVELPYAGANLSMFILLPNETATDLSEVESKLTASDLVHVKQKFEMSSSKVNLWLPKFSLDQETSLAETLVGMGMKDLFTMGVADLSGIDGSKELYVSKVIHRAVVEVNERGTEAAASTAGVLTGRSFTPQTNFRADHPFLFFIQDKSTGSVLFLGRLVKPAAA